MTAPGPMTDDDIAEAVRRLDAIDASDPESAHCDADEVLLSVAPDEVRAAWQRLHDRATRWAYAQEDSNG